MGLDDGWGKIGGHLVPPVPVGTVQCACDAAYGGWFIDFELLAICSCLRWTLQQQQVPPDWLNALPNCPCSIGNPPSNPDPIFWYPPESASPTFHPGASHCIRSIPNNFGSGQQCCYDESGALITGGLAAGTPDLSAPGGWALPHYRDDVSVFGTCMRAGMTAFYFAYRPPNNGRGCTPNVVTPF